MANPPSKEDGKRNSDPEQPGAESASPQGSGDRQAKPPGAAESPAGAVPAGGYGVEGGGYGAQSTYAAHGGYGSQGESSQGGTGFDPDTDPAHGYDVSTAQVGSGAFTQGGTGRLGHWPKDAEGSDKPPAKTQKK
ncbi:MAG TPA: hypothetical protein VD867_00075 [Burkholderiales bacterium]|nr:hypothetical protein [Burkholderiales bacterium]